MVSQSNEGFPDKTDVLTRKVNEFEGQHRFGGGTDTDCDPHAIDILAGSAVGDPGEVQAQYDMLKYECNEDGTAKKPAVLKMIYKK
ncbi:MAG: glucodextranase DOMON-like domain-containing protein [Anaeromyxobacter sp.]